ncbi:MAG: NUDIX hydrolase [Frankiaceae bacterium]
MPDSLIEAAGGVLWRPTATGIEVALVHRPKYDDWSVPKGKLKAGEHPLLGALREVEEETGSTALVGRPLGEIRYLKDGDPKRVRYWAMCEATDGFEPNDEVDSLQWLDVDIARRVVLPERDQPVLERFAADARPTWPLIVLRHASAGERSQWQGEDDERPLDELGQVQAEAIAAVLTAFHPRHLVSADVVRCLTTLAPYAARTHATVQSEPLLSEVGAATHPEAAVARCVETVMAHVPTVLCTQRKALPTLLDGLADAFPGARCGELLRKGEMYVLHFTDGGEKPEIVAVERFDSPVTALPARVDGAA